MKDITVEELDEALTIACRDRDAYAADLRAAWEEVERLRAAVARREESHRRICARLGRDVGSDDPHVAAEDAVAALVMEASGLRAELAEAQATLANERGEGEPPEERCVWDPACRQWKLVAGGKEIGFVSRGYQTRWAWEVCVGGRWLHGYALTARSAMRAAIAALPSPPETP